ncbi:MAG: c-type cytochrome [Pseudomonadota bacterium]
MMRIRAILGAGLLTLMVTACGGAEEEPPVEQIVLREPGEPAASAAKVADAAVDAAVDLVAAGEAAFAMCSACHVAVAGAASTAGPNLYGVLGRQAGSLDDYAYSDAFAGSEVNWDVAELDRFLANPTGYAPGTTMVAGAVTDGDRRAAIVAYLGSLSE